MAEGFVVGENQGVRTVSSWMEGPPRKGWFGVKSNGKPLEIQTLRCRRCGFLENYAKE